MAGRKLSPFYPMLPPKQYGSNEIRDLKNLFCGYDDICNKGKKYRNPILRADVICNNLTKSHCVYHILHTTTWSVFERDNEEVGTSLQTSQVSKHCHKFSRCFSSSTYLSHYVSKFNITVHHANLSLLNESFQARRCNLDFVAGDLLKLHIHSAYTLVSLDWPRFLIEFRILKLSSVN